VARIDHLQQVPLDGLIVNHYAVDLALSFRFDTLWQKLQGPDAVPTDCREKAKCVGGPGLEPDRDPFAYGVAVRQQSVEIVGDAVAL
jgi:hypothetical protein